MNIGTKKKKGDPKTARKDPWVEHLARERMRASKVLVYRPHLRSERGVNIVHPVDVPESQISAIVGRMRDPFSKTSMRALEKVRAYWEPHSSKLAGGGMKVEHTDLVSPEELQAILDQFDSYSSLSEVTAALAQVGASWGVWSEGQDDEEPGHIHFFKENRRTHCETRLRVRRRQ